jgi:hypothetical protein
MWRRKAVVPYQLFSCPALPNVEQQKLVLEEELLMRV